jgi:ribosomal protein L37AE/L43A
LRFSKILQKTKREMKVPRQIREWWPVALVGGLLGAIGWFAAQIAHAAADPFWKHIASAIPQTLLMSLCCLLLLTIVLLVIWVIYLHRVHREPTVAEKEKQIEDRFDTFDSCLGIWTHKIQPGFFCTKCKASHIESPLRERADGWSCAVCGKVYENPDYRRPTTPTGVELARGNPKTAPISLGFSPTAESESVRQNS